MKTRLRVIYITGVGDRDVRSQLAVVKLWRFAGVEPELFQMNWGDKEAWPPKFKRLLARIDVAADGQEVALVGISAGGSAAINAFAARQDVIKGVVCVAGKLARPEIIGPKYRRQNPALVASVTACQAALKDLPAEARQRIMSRRALRDGTVPPRDSRVPGGHNHRVLSIGHIPTIALQITLGAPWLLRFLKRLPPR